MIWIRRFLAVTLGVVLIPLFMGILLLLRINGTLLEPQFYVDQLRKADLFNFTYDAVIPALLDEFDEGSKDLHVDLDTVRIAVTSFSRVVLPPEWLQKQAEQVITQVLPYMLGSTDEFEVNVSLADRARVALETDEAPLKILLRDIGAYGQVYQELLMPAMLGLVSNLGDGAPDDHDEPLLRLPLAPEVEFSVTPQEMYEILGEPLEEITTKFLQTQVERALDVSTPYLVGDSANFSVTLEMGELVPTVMSILQRQLDEKLVETYNTLPLCSVERAVELAKGGLGSTLPACRPGGAPIKHVQQVLGAPRVPSLSQAQLEILCGCDLTLALEKVSLSEARTLLDIDFSQQLTEMALQILPEDYTFTDADLREVIDKDTENLLDNALAWLRDGYVFNHEDFREFIADTGNGTSLEDLDYVRQFVKQMRGFLFLLYLVPFMLLAMIGFLGGRQWRSRLRWASAFLAIAAGLVVITTVPVYEAGVQPRVDAVIEDALAGLGGIEHVLMKKSIDVAETAASDFLDGLTRNALILLATAIGIFAATIFFPRSGAKPDPHTPSLNQ